MSGGGLLHLSRGAGGSVSGLGWRRISVCLGEGGGGTSTSASIRGGMEGGGGGSLPLLLFGNGRRCMRALPLPGMEGDGEGLRLCFFLEVDGVEGEREIW